MTAEEQPPVTTVEAVRDALRDVVDPCSAATGSNLDVVEMGLVRAVDVAGGQVDIELRLTTPGCHMVPYFVTEAESRVGALPGVDSVHVETDEGLEWRESMLSEAARRRRQAVLDRHESRAREETAPDTRRPT